MLLYRLWGSQNQSFAIDCISKTPFMIKPASNHVTCKHVLKIIRSQDCGIYNMPKP